MGYIEKKLTKNKGYCLQISWFKMYLFYNIIDFNFKLFDNHNYFNVNFFLFGDFFQFQLMLNKKSDHAGFLFNICILGLSIHANIYDIRHWNDEENKWE